MKIIKQHHKILKMDREVHTFIEKCARVCYKSEDKITQNSTNRLIRAIINAGHHSVLEHGNISVQFVTDRAVTHELVRHRLASFSQESQRYVNYKKGIEFIKPTWIPASFAGEYKTRQAINIFCNNLGSVDCCENERAQLWFYHMLQCENTYRDMIKKGLRPEQARTILPNSTKTEIIVTANIREWRHIFKLRCSKKAYPQIRELLIPLFTQCCEISPILFKDLKQ